MFDHAIDFLLMKKDIKELYAEFAQKAYDLMKEIPRDENENPLTFEGTIRSIMLKGPAMHPYRDDALNTMFCVLGAGIRWSEDGRIVDSGHNNYINMPPAAGGQGCWSRDFGIDETFSNIFGDDEERKKKFEASYMKDREEDAKKVITTILEIDKRCQTYSPKQRVYWYPISWYSANICAPKNAQEDYLVGALETLHLIIDHEPPRGTQKWVEHQRTKKYAEEMLRALKEAHDL
jgi:hypothetical protein